MTHHKPDSQHDIVFRQGVQRVLDRVRPYLQRDGGNIELVAIVGNHANVRLTGHCVECPTAHLTLHLGIEMAIKEALPDFDGLVLV
jgi:Fe-S cluster biogenesis protein NfuA